MHLKFEPNQMFISLKKASMSEFFKKWHKKTGQKGYVPYISYPSNFWIWYHIIYPPQKKDLISYHISSKRIYIQDIISLDIYPLQVWFRLDLSLVKLTMLLSRTRTVPESPLASVCEKTTKKPAWLLVFMSFFFCFKKKKGTILCVGQVHSTKVFRVGQVMSCRTSKLLGVGQVE